MDSDAFRDQYGSTQMAEYKVKGKIQYEDLPKVAKMMVQYAGVQYDPEIHSPSMEEDSTPHWLTDEQQDHKFVHIYDLDGKVTRDFILCRSLGWILNLMPNTHDDLKRCEEIETELFFLLNRMTWMINKVCYDPEREISYDENYAKNRFSRRMRLNLPHLNILIATQTDPPSDLITGPTPVYADFLAYACLSDLKEFVPRCFAGINNKPITLFFRHMEEMPALKEWFETDGKEGEYIRPPQPSIKIRIGYFA